MITEETGKVDWARILLDQGTDDLIINVSREKIAHELIKLRTEVNNFKSGTISHQNTYQSDRQQNTSSQLSLK